jgi:hypothetical protein
VLGLLVGQSLAQQGHLGRDLGGPCALDPRGSRALGLGRVAHNEDLAVLGLRRTARRERAERPGGQLG